MLAGLAGSVGTVGDALDNALMESAIGLYKTELVSRRGPWRGLAHGETGNGGDGQWVNHPRNHPPDRGVNAPGDEAAR